MNPIWRSFIGIWTRRQNLLIYFKKWCNSAALDSTNTIYLPSTIFLYTPFKYDLISSLDCLWSKFWNQVKPHHFHIFTTHHTGNTEIFLSWGWLYEFLGATDFILFLTFPLNHSTVPVYCLVGVICVNLSRYALIIAEISSHIRLDMRQVLENIVSPLPSATYVFWTSSSIGLFLMFYIYLQLRPIPRALMISECFLVRMCISIHLQIWLSSQQGIQLGQ